jgi:hypothetical protein
MSEMGNSELKIVGLARGFSGRISLAEKGRSSTILRASIYSYPGTLKHV